MAISTFVSFDGKKSLGFPAICAFILRVYLSSWYTAPSAITAARNDLSLMKKLQEYAGLSEYKDLYKNVAKKRSNHLWYLGEQNVAMALYDQGVSLEEKKEMVHQIKTRKPMKNARIRFDGLSLTEYKTASLPDFCSQRTLDFWDITQLSKSFIELDPKLWESCEEFKKLKDRISSLRVVNDCAERGVALIQSYCGKITKNEQQLQFLLKVVEDNRRKYPDTNRTTLFD